MITFGPFNASGIRSYRCQASRSLEFGSNHLSEDAPFYDLEKMRGLKIIKYKTATVPVMAAEQSKPDFLRCCRETSSLACS